MIIPNNSLRLCFSSFVGIGNGMDQDRKQGIVDLYDTDTRMILSKRTRAC